MTDAGKPHVLNDMEWSRLLDACRMLTPASGDYRVDDYVENLLLTVVDFQLNTTTVNRAMKHFREETKKEAEDLVRLKAVLSQYTDDKEGNTALAQRLWGYKLWTRAAMLRQLVGYFEGIGVVDQPSLEAWALQADFVRDFMGQVKGLGFAVFHWLIMRQGVDSIKPDVHVLRFVAKAAGRPIDQAGCVRVLKRAAKDLKISVHKLDWAIWEAGRSPEKT